MLVFGILVGIGLYGLWRLKDCYFRVSEGEVGIVISFGAARRDNHGKLRTYGPGLHRKAPWQRVARVSLREHAIELAGENGSQRVMTDDGTVLRIDTILRYAPNLEDLDKLLFELHSPEPHISSLFSCVLRNEIANVTQQSESQTADLGSYARLRHERGLLSERLADFYRTKIGRRYGVEFRAADVTQILPPDELADALNAMMQAQAAADTALYRAESETQRKVLAAEQGVAIARARAAAAAEEVTTLGNELTHLAQAGVLEAYVQRRRSEILAESKLVYMKQSEQLP